MEYKKGGITRKHVINKRLMASLFLSLAIFTSLLTFSTNASYVTVDLPYWYSSADYICYHHGKTTLSVYYDTHTTDSNLELTDIQGYITTSFSRWYAATGLSYSFTSNISTADISVAGITRVTASLLGYPSSAIGVTSFNKTKVAEGFYSGKTYNIEKFSGRVNVFLIDESAPSNYSDWLKVAVHEMGHAFGYAGHYESNGVMKTYYEDTTTSYPSSNNLNHLSMVY